VEHSGAMPRVWWKVQNFTRAYNSLGVTDGKQHRPAFDDRHLLMRMTVRRGDEPAGKPQAADRETLASDHLPPGTVGELFAGYPSPITVLKLQSGLGNVLHFRADLPASNPEPVEAKSGCTLTTPN